VVVLAGGLLEKAKELLDAGVHPSRICRSYSAAAASKLHLLTFRSYHQLQQI